jgi:hypothetical protein
LTALHNRLFNLIAAGRRNIHVDILVQNIFIPLVIGVITPFIVEWIKNRGRLPLSWSIKKRATVGAVAAVIFAVGFFLFLPPYKVSRVGWCKASDQEIKVTGRLTVSLLGTSADNGEVQVKIYQIGEDHPVAPEEFARTSADGMFDVIFRLSPTPTDKPYLVNVAYKYRALFLWERWQISDFTMGGIKQCQNS